MKKALFVLLSLSFFNFAFAQHDHALTNAKVAHDASHRVGKLVDTGKVDELFLKNMNVIEVIAIPHTDHTGPAFAVTVSAGSGNGQVNLKFDMAGKFLPPQVLTGTSVATENVWEVDSSEILEAALHWVMEASSPGVDFAPFTAQLAKAELKQQKNEDGTIRPVVQLSSGATSKILQVALTSRGEFISFSVME